MFTKNLGDIQISNFHEIQDALMDLPSYQNVADAEANMGLPSYQDVADAEHYRPGWWLNTIDTLQLLYLYH